MGTCKGDEGEREGGREGWRGVVDMACIYLGTPVEGRNMTYGLFIVFQGN